MKKIHYILLLAVSFMLTSCEEWYKDWESEPIIINDELAAFVKVINPETGETYESKSEFEYGENAAFNGSIIEVKLKTNSPDRVQVESESVLTTCDYNPSTKTIRISIPKNADTTSNKFQFTVSLAGVSKDVVKFYIMQDGPQYSFSNDLTYQPAKAPYAGGTYSIPTESNCPNDMNVSVEFYYSSYEAGQTVSATYNPASKQILVQVPYNAYGSEREFKVQMWYGSNGTKKTTYFYQLGPGVSNATATPKLIDTNGGSATITFDCTCDWTISTSASWVHFNRAAGMGGSDVQVIATCDPNTGSERSAYVTIKPISGSSESFYIKQAAVELTVSKDYFACHNNSFPEGSSFTLTASGKWSIKSADSWLSLSKTSGGAGEHNLDVVCDYKAWNQGLEYRQGNIVIQLDGTSKTVSLMVRQYY